MENLQIINLDSVGSTSDYAWDLGLAGAPEITAVIAREQTGGHGRFDRCWSSPRDKGLYLSLLLRPANTRSLSFLSLTAAYSVIKALPELDSLRIKWPNDLLLGGSKLAGILLKSSTVGEEHMFVVLSIGINVTAARDELPEGATSLFLHTGKEYHTASLFDTIVVCFRALYDRFNAGETKTILEELMPYSDTIGRDVKVLSRGQWTGGRAVSFDEQGRLTIKTADGTVRSLLPQEVVHLR